MTRFKEMEEGERVILWPERTERQPLLGEGGCGGPRGLRKWGTKEKVCEPGMEGGGEEGPGAPPWWTVVLPGPRTRPPEKEEGGGGRLRSAEGRGCAQGPGLTGRRAEEGSRLPSR